MSDSDPGSSDNSTVPSTQLPSQATGTASTSAETASGIRILQGLVTDSMQSTMQQFLTALDSRFAAAIQTARQQPPQQQQPSSVHPPIAQPPVMPGGPPQPQSLAVQQTVPSMLLTNNQTIPGGQPQMAPLVPQLCWAYPQVPAVGPQPQPPTIASQPSTSKP